MNMIDLFQSIFFILLIFAAAPVLLVIVFLFTIEILNIIDFFIDQLKYNFRHLIFKRDIRNRK